MPDAVASARVAVDRLRSHRAMRRGASVVAVEALRRGAVAAAAIETGTPLSPTRDQRLLSPEDESPEDSLRESSVEAPGDPHTGRTVRGAGRAYGDLTGLAGAWSHSPLQVLARLHLLAAKEIVGSDLLGRPRSAAGVAGEGTRTGAIGGPYDAALGALLPAPLVAQRLDALTQVLGATRAPALVVAAVVHAEIATVRPFAWGNHIVALAAQRLTLSTRGMDPGSHVAAEVGHLLAADEYREALAAYAAGSPAGVARWIAHCGHAVVGGAREGLAICEALGR